MFLKKLKDYDHSTPEKINSLDLSKVLIFVVIVIIGILFSSLTETESAVIIPSGSSPLSAAYSSTEAQLTINSR